MQIVVEAVEGAVFILFEQPVVAGKSQGPGDDPTMAQRVAVDIEEKEADCAEHGDQQPHVDLGQVWPVEPAPDQEGNKA